MCRYGSVLSAESAESSPRGIHYVDGTQPLNQIKRNGYDLIEDRILEHLIGVTPSLIPASRLDHTPKSGSQSCHTREGIAATAMGISVFILDPTEMYCSSYVRS